jgi:hypothetical protein
MDDAPPEQQTALLPVEKLKQLCLDQRVDYTFKEFRLQGETESLKDFVDMFLLENRRCNTECIVWITENSFARLGSGTDLPSECYRDQRFSLKLSTSDVFSYNPELSIHSSSTEEAIAAPDLLAGLHDSYFEKMELQYNSGRNGQRPVCPLRGRHLEIFVCNPNRQNSFYGMVFTRDQCGTLATSGIRTNVGFWNCEFEDEGIAFVEAFAARENQEAGPCKLSIRGRLLIDEGNFRLFLSQYTLESLTLYGIVMRHVDSCRALATADLQNLAVGFWTEGRHWSNPSGMDVVRGDLVFCIINLALQKDSSPSSMHCGGIRIFRDLTSRKFVLVMAPPASTR